MRVIFHQLIKKDLRAALGYYDAEGGSRLGDRFFDEVETVVEAVRANPRGFRFIEAGLRRAGLQSFPYHFIFEESDVFIHFLVLRHDRRHPGFGLRRVRRAR